MLHRHLNHERMTLAAVDDIIVRGKMGDWLELRKAVLADRALAEKILRPVQILGCLDGIETGIRQLIRNEPLQVERKVCHGHEITLPTAEEMLRIKGVLILKRNATRDYLDFIALHQLPYSQIPSAHFFK
jgi:hypothetical protein